MFSSLKEKAKEPAGDVPCGGHFRIRQNLSDQAKGWLGSKWMWLLFVGLLYAIVRLRGESDKNKVRIQFEWKRNIGLPLCFVVYLSWIRLYFQYRCQKR